MNHDSKLFDVASSRLHTGVNLVEASAGTGKTYAIAMMVLRFITEHPILIENILLVTFTRAATEELAARIRLRLAEARDMLLGRSGDFDPALQHWYANLDNTSLSLERIRIALNDIDQAAIFTIHGFCQRMLKEQAMESGQLFDVELRTDVSKVRLQVAEDFWRHNLYSLPPRQCGIITSVFDGPERLLDSVQPLPGYDTVIEPETCSPAQAGAEVEHYYQVMHNWWRLKSDVLNSQLQQLISDKKVKTEFCKDFPEWWQDLQRYFTGESYTPPHNLHYLSKDGFATLINGSRVRGKKREELLAEISLADAEIMPFLQAAETLILSLRVTMARTLVEEVDRKMRQANLMSFNDLIHRLHKAVIDRQGGDLRKLLRQRYNVVLIDEFQDTDAEQWRIFSEVFGKGTYLYLIGDPKQAVYRFRGADINSYFSARTSSDYRLTLAKNYRSHPGLVAEINRLFLGRSQPFVFAENVLGYSPVLAGKTPEDGYLSREGHTLGNMVYAQLDSSAETKDGRWTSGKAASAIMKFVLKEIVTLLRTPVVLHEKNAADRPLLPRDIAILVRNNAHGEAYLQCLGQAGIPAVIASRKSVYQTEECAELMVLLQALAQPGDVELLKKAMTGSWFGLSGDQLYQIFANEESFASWHAKFQIYAKRWYDGGFLVMMTKLLHDEKVFITLSTTAQAERKIANINHLLEVIQDGATEGMLGPVQTLQWMRETVRRGEKEEELRLESDEDAVRIVTMHGAKGLQYPVVFCPYLWYRQARAEREKNCISTYENSLRVVDLGSIRFAERRQKAGEEELSEDLRLLYVAVTRAKLRCYTLWCDMKGHGGSPVDSFYSALGYLLFGGEQIPFADQQGKLRQFADTAEVEYLLVAANDEARYDSAVAKTHRTMTLRQPTRSSLHTDRQMTSYSALAAISSTSHRDGIVVNPVPPGEITEFATFPAGASFGNVVHDIFETIPFSQLLQPERHRQRILQKCVEYNVNAEVGLLEKLLATIVSTPLVVPEEFCTPPFTLAELDQEKCIKEMAFYFHLEREETSVINTILAGDKTVVPLNDKVVQGYLTGFVDLVFAHGGRFYIADYKTNYLGDTLADYGKEQLVRAMASHNYGLQYWLYTIVLHRYLGNFHPDYDFARHFGGVFYLFVRGMSKKSASGVFFARPDYRTLERLDSSLGGTR